MSAGAERAGELRAAAASLRGAFEAAVRTFSLRALVAEALPPLPPKRAVVRVAAIGKAALPMVLGALDRWPDRVERALAITVDSPEAAALRSDRVTVLTAAHPVPDERSVAAAEAALALFGGLTERDLAVALISGGASSLASAPPEGMSLDDKRALVRELLASGATIREVNLVRRHLSRIKGGRLAAAAAPARVLTLAASDVIAGAMHDIGSGPSVPDPTAADEARAVLARFAPAWAERAPLSESLRPADAPRWRARLIASPATFASHLAAALAGRRASAEEEAEPEGRSPIDDADLAGTTDAPAGTARWRVTVLRGEEGDSEVVATRRVKQALEIAPGEALVIPCEPTVRLPPSPGRGGRAGRVALRALLDLPADVALLCGATDGVDGASGAAGAVVTAVDRAAAQAGEIERALAAFDDAAVHARLGTHLPLAPSGLNFTDVHVLARLP